MAHTFITQLLCHLDQIKLYHWTTTRYARHIASDDLHGKLSKLVDLFVETYLGEQGTRPSFAEAPVISLEKYEGDADLAYVQLTNLHDYLNTDLMQVAGSSIALKHIIEEMCTAVCQAKYLYTFS
jgi:hypothetical protein